MATGPRANLENGPGPHNPRAPRAPRQPPSPRDDPQRPQAPHPSNYPTEQMTDANATMRLLTPDQHLWEAIPQPNQYLLVTVEHFPTASLSRHYLSPAEWFAAAQKLILLGARIPGSRTA